MFTNRPLTGSSTFKNPKENSHSQTFGEDTTSALTSLNGASDRIVSPALFQPPKSGTDTQHLPNRLETPLDSQSSSRTTSNSTAQTLKPSASGSELSLTAIEAPHRGGVELASAAAHQIVADKKEVVDIIGQYGVEPYEMLHLVDRWLQQLLGEFKDKRNEFKYALSEKWQKQELLNVTYDNNDRLRNIYALNKELETARDVTLSSKSFNELHDYLRTINDSESAEMKARFNALAEDYRKIVKCLEEIDREIKMNNGWGGDDYINDIKKSLVKLKQLNSKQSHTICIVGLEKAGKSTFINALVGYELLPAAAERCTQVRTVLKPIVNDGDQQLFATVKFYSDDQFRVFFDQMVQKTGESQQQLDDRKRAVTVARDGLRAKFPEEHFRIKNSTNVDEERLAIRKKLNEYITGEVYCNIIKEIAIYTDRLPGKNYELLDVPGFDSPIKEHYDAGLEAVKTADAFIFLNNGQQPSLTQPQVHLINAIQQNHFEAMDRAFGIITRLDLCLTATKFQEHYAEAHKELILKSFKPDHIYVACPRLQLLPEGSEEYQVISSKLRMFSNDLAEGFERSKEGLNRFIEHELPKTHLKQLIDLGRLKLRGLVTERLNEIRERQLLPLILGDVPIDDFIRQQKIQSWDTVYGEQIFTPAFANANRWHGETVTKERAKFIEDVRRTFNKAFRDRTVQFLESQQDIQKQMYGKYSFSALHYSPHDIDNEVRDQLSFQLEKIVDETSDVLAEHFYHQYVCGIEKVLNDVCPDLKDLFRPTLKLQKCTNETHALVLRVCRPIITATLRYSHLDVAVKMHAINELIYIAPTVAYNIAKNSEVNGSSETLSTNINKAIGDLINNDEMTTQIIRTLFSK